MLETSKTVLPQSRLNLEVFAGQDRNLYSGLSAVESQVAPPAKISRQLDEKLPIHAEV